MVFNSSHQRKSKYVPKDQENDQWMNEYEQNKEKNNKNDNTIHRSIIQAVQARQEELEELSDQR